MAKLHRIISERRKVVDFLSQMKAIFSSESYNPDRDFVFQRCRDKDEPDYEFTNENTLLALDYDTSDVVEELKTLRLDEYSESMIDNVAEGFNPFYVFGRTIQGRDVYIKVRLKQRESAPGQFVFCVSFHFARHPITAHPYK